MGLPYTIILKKYPEGGYFAEVKELPGCMTEADAREEVLAMIEDAMKGWVELAIEDGHPIPEPAVEDSLNQYLVYQLSKSVKS
ncbi:MAG: type II toxin-antitoxin system HicB family antitoxin [Eubacteriales bacterium]